MSRLHDMKVGAVKKPTKKFFKENRNDKMSIWDRLKAYLKKGEPEKTPQIERPG